MKQSEFRCETYASPHVSILNNLSSDSDVRCRGFQRPIRTRTEYGRAIPKAFSNHYIRSRIVGDPLTEDGFPLRFVQ